MTDSFAASFIRRWIGWDRRKATRGVDPEIRTNARREKSCHVFQIDRRVEL